MCQQITHNFIAKSVYLESRLEAVLQDLDKAHNEISQEPMRYRVAAIGILNKELSEMPRVLRHMMASYSS